MSDKQVQKIRWEDGRHAEKHVVEWHQGEDGNEQREVELYVEPERQLNLKQRVIEKRRPVVYHRTTQTIDGDQVVDQVVEERDEDKLSIVEHIATVNQGRNLRKQDDCGCGELAGEVRNLVNALQNQQQMPQQRRLSRAEVEPQVPLQDSVANRLQDSSTALLVINGGLTLVIMGLLGAIGYWAFMV